MLKWDPLAETPSPKALTMTTTGGRAQIQMQNRPSTMNAMIPMMELSSGQKTYEQTPSNGVNGKTQAPYQVWPLEDPLEEPIPPKPPYFDCPNKAMIQPTSYGQSML